MKKQGCKPNEIPDNTGGCIPKREIIDIARSHIEECFFPDDDTYTGVQDTDFRIKKMAVVGSRAKGAHTKESDIDVLVEYEGTMEEDHAFNWLNGGLDPQDELKIHGIHIDINPIKKEDTGTMKEWMKNKYHINKK